jgi:hypothetical protein
MSQHRTTFEHPEHGPVTILWGWDPPLGTFFITALDENDEYVGEPAGMLRHEITDITDAIAKWPTDLCCVPESFAKTLLDDQAHEGETWSQKNPAIQALLEKLQAQIEETNRKARLSAEIENLGSIWP